MIAEPANDSKSNEKRSSSDEKFSSGAATPQDLEKQSADSEASSPDGGKPSDAPNYPPTKEVILIMLSLYLVMFLMALVSPYITIHGTFYSDSSAGPNYNSHCYPLHNRRLQLLRRRRLVRQRLHADNLLFHLDRRARVDLRHSEMAFLGRHLRLRTWIGHLRRCSLIDELHCWARNCRSGRSWYRQWSDLHYAKYHSTGKKANIPGLVWVCVWDCFGRGTAVRWCLY